MLTTTFRQTREIIGEWRRRTRSRHELAMLGELGQRDLACRFDVKSEIHKPFWLEPNPGVPRRRPAARQPIKGGAGGAPPWQSPAG